MKYAIIIIAFLGLLSLASWIAYTKSKADVEAVKGVQTVVTTEEPMPIKQEEIKKSVRKIRTLFYKSHRKVIFQLFFRVQRQSVHRLHAHQDQQIRHATGARARH